MRVFRLRAAMTVATILFVPLASRAWAQVEPGPYTTATLTVSGMT